MLELDVKVTRAFAGARGTRDATARHNWWPVAYSRDLQADPSRPRAVTLFGEPLVLFTAADGSVQCVADVCAHASAALSQGYVERGELVCRYHGWRYRKGGLCSHPSELAGKKATTLYSYPAVDDGLIVWVYPSHDEPVEFVNPLAELTGRLGIQVRPYLAREFEFHQAWELWAASFIDRTHHEHAHPKTIIRSQRESVEVFFDEGLSPAVTAVNAKHDRMLGFFTYLLFSPVDEHRHRQFLTLFPTSDILPASLSYRLFNALRIPKVIANIAYEDYYLIVKQAERIGQGAPRWGIRGKYAGSPASARFVDWHVSRDGDAVWFRGYGPGGAPVLGERRSAAPGPSELVHDSGFDIGPYAGGDRRLREPATWRRLHPLDRAVKALVTQVMR